MTSPKRNRITGVFVTQDIQSFDAEFMRRVSGYGLDECFLIINNDSNDPNFMIGAFNFIHVGKNIGGAGGFSLGIKLALETEPDWIWTCDDDARSEKVSIAKQLSYLAEQNDFDLLAPIVISPQAASRLSFPFRIGGRRIWDRNQIKTSSFIRGQAHLFNGTLFSAQMIKSVGLPDSRLFIRGDEQEYLLRIKKKGFQIATATEVAIIHPSGEDELYPTLFGLLRIPIPHTPFKLSHQIRNRGYITRKFRRWDWFIIDVIRYVSFFFFRKKPQLAAAKVLLSLYSLGLKGRIHSDCPIIETETWIAIQNLILTRPVGDPK